MDIWQILNSPFVLTLLSVGLGGWMLAALSRLWQERAARKKLQIDQLHRTLETFHLYVRVVRSGGETLAGDEWGRLHARLKALAKINKVLFASAEASSGWEWVAQALANQRDRVLKTGEPVGREAFAPIRQRAHAAEQAMLEEIV